jgi:RHS repeat-associated protein
VAHRTNPCVVRYGGSTHVANGVESYTYDAFGRLSSIQDLTNLVGGGTPAGQAAQTNRFDYLYDAAGNLKEEKYAKAGGWLGDRFTYDEYHRLKKAYMGVSSALISPNPPTPSADPTGYSSANTKQLVEYDLDEAQNRLGVTETTSGGPVGFGYQLEESGLSNRYLQAHDAKPEYDKRGNLIYDGQFYYRYDFLNRLQEVWRVLVEAAGAMQSAPESGDKYIVVDEVPALEESRQEVYEEVDNLLHRVPLEHKNPTFRSRLRSDIPGGVIRVPSATSTATSGGGMPQFFLPAKLELVALYGYDAFNRRVIRAVVNEDTYVTSYDGWREAVEHTLSLTTFQAKPTKQFVYGSRLDEMVAYRRYTGLGWETYYIQHGGQDTAAKLVSESGVVVEQYEYDAYGKATVYNSTWGLAGDGTKSAYGLPHMWKGIRRDPETGLLYMRNRFYSVVAGQFLSSDPIGVWGDAGNMGNEYAYAWNRPVVVGDALGLQTDEARGSGGSSGADWDRLKGQLDLLRLQNERLALALARDAYSCSSASVNGEISDDELAGLEAAWRKTSAEAIQSMRDLLRQLGESPLPTELQEASRALAGALASGIITIEQAGDRFGEAKKIAWWRNGSRYTGYAFTAIGVATGCWYLRAALAAVPAGAAAAPSGMTVAWHFTSVTAARQIIKDGFLKAVHNWSVYFVYAVPFGVHLRQVASQVTSVGVGAYVRFLVDLGRLRPDFNSPMDALGKAGVILLGQNGRLLIDKASAVMGRIFPWSKAW